MLEHTPPPNLLLNCTSNCAPRHDGESYSKGLIANDYFPSFVDVSNLTQLLSKLLVVGRLLFPLVGSEISTFHKRQCLSYKVCSLIIVGQVLRVEASLVICGTVSERNLISDIYLHPDL